MTNPPASSRKVVVVGGGIIGCSTAYQLKQRGADVTILEASSIAAGASGKAGGFLAYDWCDGQATESLTHLGFKMHRQFADLFGADSTGYRALETASVAFDVAGKGRGKKVPGADWINDSAVRQSAKLGGTDTTAQVHPRLLTERLAKEVGSTVIAQAEGIEYGTDGRPIAVLARERDASEQIRLDCTDVVLAAGPWSGKLVKKLFKDDPAIDTSDYNVVGSRAHSIVLKSSEPLSAVALFTSIRTGKKSSEPELYCRPDGTGYLCGPTDNEPLPERADQVTVDPSAIDTLKAEATIIAPNALGEKAETVAEQACFLPISRSTGSPMLTEMRKGVFFAAGHSCWGILQSGATGLAMSELILDGRVSCCDISDLRP